MYQGLRNTDIKELAEKLEQEKLVKRDLVLPANSISMNDGLFQIQNLPSNMFEDEAVKELLSSFNISGTDEPLKFAPTDVAKIHVANKLNMPRKFYRYLEAEHVDMLDYNVSELFSRTDKNYFLRSFAPMDGDVGLIRALLSDRYQVVDNIDVLYATLQAIKKADADVQIGKCNLTEKKMYIEFLRPEANITAEEYFNKYDSPDGGDDGQIYAGFVISNSEVGQGSYSITPRAIVGACKNGLVFKKDAMRKTHLGSVMEEGIHWSQQTRDKELEFIQSQITDAVSHFMSEDFLYQKIDDMKRHTKRLEHPTQATENVCKEIGISDDEKNDVLNYFIDGGDFSPVGVVQAVTFHAHEQPDADKQYQYESDVMEILPDIAKRFDIANN